MGNDDAIRKMGQANMPDPIGEIATAEAHARDLPAETISVKPPKVPPIGEVATAIAHETK